MRGSWTHGPFRNCQVAAPLKRPCPAVRVLHGHGLPQLSSCGPIEAYYEFLEFSGASGLPQLSSCGPIEADTPLRWRDVYGPPSATVKLRPH